MTPEVKEELNILKSRAKEGDSRFVKHLEIYHRDREDDKKIFQEMKLQNEAIIKTQSETRLLLEPMVEMFKGSKFTINAAIYIFRFLAVVGAGVAAFIYLTSKGK